VCLCSAFLVDLYLSADRTRRQQHVFPPGLLLPLPAISLALSNRYLFHLGPYRLHPILFLFLLFLQLHNNRADKHKRQDVEYEVAHAAVVLVVLLLVLGSDFEEDVVGDLDGEVELKVEVGAFVEVEGQLVVEQLVGPVDVEVLV
jgi:hypothetical protein